MYHRVMLLTLFCYHANYMFQSTYVPGMVYFVCGGLATLCICTLFGLPETMNANLADKIQESEKKQKGNNIQTNDGQPHIISVKF